jgi:DNA-directed RNA polymerase omega subunit
MPKPKTEKEVGGGGAAGEQWPGIDSHFRLIAVAALRSKQLLRGARPRITADPTRRRNTSIALEEVKRGLVRFTVTAKPQGDGGNGDNHEGVISAD